MNQRLKMASWRAAAATSPAASEAGSARSKFSTMPRLSCPMPAQAFHRRAVCEQDMVHGAGGGADVAQAGGVVAEEMRQEGHAPRLVDGGDGMDPVADPAGDDLGVIGEPARDIAVGPAAQIGQCPRAFPSGKASGTASGPAPACHRRGGRSSPAPRHSPPRAPRASPAPRRWKSGRRPSRRLPSGQGRLPTGGRRRRREHRPARPPHCRGSRRRYPSGRGRSRQSRCPRSGRRRWPRQR